MKHLVYIGVFLGALFFTSCKQEQVSPLVPKAEFSLSESYAIGELKTAEAKFKAEAGVDTKQVKLFLEAGVYQATLAPTHCESGNCTFEIPEILSNKTGLSQWRLSFEDTSLGSGSFQVVPADSSVYSINTYIGPPSAKAGKVRAAMAVAIPRDAHDNLIRKPDSVQMDYRYLNQQTTTESSIRYGLSFIEFDAGPIAGNFQLGGSYKGAEAKAAQFIIMPNEAVDFELQPLPEHDIADGQQELEVITSVIRDRFGNPVADGTGVSLRIDQSDGVTAYVSAITANGIARFIVLHPDEAMDWSLQASLNNGAISNQTSLSYRSFMDAFPVELTAEDQINVGPITGRLNERVTDGIIVRLFDANDILLLENQTRNGMVFFDLIGLSKTPKLPLRINAMGINQTVE
ncbi:Ig-like domain-containing protein [Gilvibacter sp.]|uniref:Ig-like domain-containing protein n=1 Tax=Gilvibacter sp. TaxID=2729997 RepID=UPI003F4A4160